MIKTGEKIPADAVVCLDGRPVVKEEKKIVLLFYKPRGNCLQYKEAAQ